VNINLIGNLGYQVLDRGENPPVVSVVTVMVLIYVLARLQVDLLYSALDRRIRYAYSHTALSTGTIRCAHRQRRASSSPHGHFSSTRKPVETGMESTSPELDILVFCLIAGDHIIRGPFP